MELINSLSDKNNGFNLALTLNFNPSHLTGTINLQQVQNKINEFWKLYCSYNLGRDCSKYKSMGYIGFVEHIDSNIHAHLAIKHPKKSISDDFIYDEGIAIQTLWKTTLLSGSVYLDKIYSDGWFYYITKSADFMNKMGVTPLMIATFNAKLYHIAILYYYGANLLDTCAIFDLDALDIAQMTKIPAVIEMVENLKKR